MFSFTKIKLIKLMFLSFTPFLNLNRQIKKYKARSQYSVFYIELEQVIKNLDSLQND